MLYAAAIRPMPVRHAASTQPRWLQAIFHACAIVFAALAVAPLLTLVLDFLGPVAFPTSVIICCFPIYIWMFYCRISGVTRDSVPVPVGLALSLILSFAAIEGFAALPKVLLSLAIMIPVLATQWLIGKVLLAALAPDHANAICDLSAPEHIKSLQGLNDASLAD